MIDPPTACGCCGGKRLRKLGEDVTQTLEMTPRRWKVIETVREKSPAATARRSARRRARFHVIPRALVQTPRARHSCGYGSWRGQG